MTLTDTELEAWRDGAAAAGDSETMLVAQIALGEKPNLSGAAHWSCGEAVLRRLRRYTPRGARKIAARWGTPWPEEDGR